MGPRKANTGAINARPVNTRIKGEMEREGGVGSVPHGGCVKEG